MYGKLTKRGSSEGSRATLKVDARGPAKAIDEFDTVPQTTCFGFRRKPATKKSSKELREELGAALADKPEQAVSRKLDKVSSSRLCGAGAILRTFSVINTDILATDPSLFQRKSNSFSKSSQSGVGNAEDDQASSATKIMASYDNILDTKQEGFGNQEDHEEERDGDRDDGADSIEEEDTFSTPSWTVDPHDIYFISKGDGSNRVCRLGKGDFGPVYLGVWKDQEVAVKLGRQKPISLKQERNYQKQVARLHSLSHPNLVQFLGACCWKGGKRSVLVTEYMDKSDLRGLLGREDLTAKFAWVRHGQTIALDIAQGLAYLHSKGIVHGRLKSSNVLMNKAGIAKISDAALLKLLSHCKDMSMERTAPASRLAALTASIAPEVLAGSPPTAAADIYSFGVILWELLSMERPDKTLRSIRSPEEAPAKIAYLVECCLAPNPEDRLTADKIVAVISGKS